MVYYLAKAVPPAERELPEGVAPPSGTGQREIYYRTVARLPKRVGTGLFNLKGADQVLTTPSRPEDTMNEPSQPPSVSLTPHERMFLDAFRSLRRRYRRLMMDHLNFAVRNPGYQASKKIVISGPQDVANLVMAEMALLDQEHLRVLVLNTKNEVLSVQEIYVGNVNKSVVRPAEVIRPAVIDNAPSIIVVHNHPSGDPTPSLEDVSLTFDLVAAGDLLGVAVLDHLVIGNANRYVSLNE